MVLVRATDAIRMCRDGGYQVVRFGRATISSRGQGGPGKLLLREFVARARLSGFPVSRLDDSAVSTLLETALRSGQLAVLRECDAEPADQSDRYLAQRRLVREIEAKSRRRLHHAGRQYRLVTDASLGRLSDRESFEVVGHDDAVRVLHALAAQSAVSDAGLPRLLAEAAGLLTRDWRPPLVPDGLVLLRKIIVQEAYRPDQEAALTPSQLKKLAKSDWIEVEVVDQEGEPCPARYRLELPEGEIRNGECDADGFLGVYEIESGTCKLTCPVPAPRPESADSSPAAEAPPGAAESPETAPAPAARESPPAVPRLPQAPSESLAPVDPEETAWFDVMVLAEGGAPVEGIELVYSIANQSMAATTDASGRARVEGPAGASGSARFADSEQVRNRLHDLWATPGPSGTDVSPSGPDVLKMALARNLPPFSVAADRPVTMVLQPYVARVRLIGMFFDHGKCFLLPSAVPGMRKLRSLYEDHPGATIIVTGHTDTKHSHDDGEQYNLELSDDRAKAVLAFLRDDVESWYAWYGFPAWKEKHWGTPEDKHLLSSLPAGADQKYLRPGVSLDQAIRAFQADHGLSVDGDPGPITRRALIRDYMSHDATTLPADVDAKTYACGWYFLDVDTGPNADEPRNRRVDIFLFDGVVLPPYPGPRASQGSPEYPAWRLSAADTHDFSTDGQSSDGDCHVFYELRAYDTDAPLGQQPYTLTVQGQTRSGQTDAQGGLHEVSLDPDDYLLEVAGARMFVNAFSSQETRRRLTVLADPA